MNGLQKTIRRMVGLAFFFRIRMLGFIDVNVESGTDRGDLVSVRKGH